MSDESTLNYLTILCRHITFVKDACELLGKKIIAEDIYDEDFGVQLIARGCVHDNSKFSGIEFMYLNTSRPSVTKEQLEMAVTEHISSNDHHPEYWGGVKNMPEIALAEMVCDWYARSCEMGTDLRLWIKDTALEKFDIPPTGAVSKKINKFVTLLLTPTFK